MASTAQVGLGTKLRIGTASGTAINITGASKATQCVLTATNTLAPGDIIYVSGVSGMTELNNRVFVVGAATGTSITLKGEDSTNYNTYVSGGTATKETMTDIGNVASFSGFDGSAPEIDTTNLDSTAAEYVLGLQDFGSCSLEVQLDTADAGQIALVAARAAAVQKSFTITLKSGKVAGFRAFVKSFTVDISPQKANGGKVDLRITGNVTFFV